MVDPRAVVLFLHMGKVEIGIVFFLLIWIVLNVMVHPRLVALHPLRVNDREEVQFIRFPFDLPRLLHIPRVISTRMGYRLVCYAINKRHFYFLLPFLVCC